jgi:hypothetical protein
MLLPIELGQRGVSSRHLDLSYWSGLLGALTSTSSAEFQPSINHPPPTHQIILPAIEAPKHFQVTISSLLFQSAKRFPQNLPDNF